jgi:hypothetical protein
MGRKIRDRDDAVACLSAWQASGLPLSAWSQSNGVDGRSLHCWQVNLRRGRRSKTTAAVVELVPRRDAPLARYVVRVDDVEVEVGDDFREDTLERLLRVLVAC